MKVLRRSLVGLVVIGLMGVSAAALAEHDETHSEDTEFSFGYDSSNHFLAINLGPNDTLYRCLFENGALSATYGDPDENGVVPVDSLEDDEGPVEFAPRPEEELADGLEEASDPAQYSGADGECGVFGGVVSGPNGQVNHGQFMKMAIGLLDMTGHGCLVRHLAKSDIGKTDETKVRTGEADPLFEMGDSGEIEFTTIEADCFRGKKAKGEKGKSEGKGKPESPGKSASAPGKNK